jgi:hypothetical protein
LIEGDTYIYIHNVSTKNIATIAATEDIKSDANELANIAIEHKIYTRTSRKYYQMSHIEVKGSLEATLEHNLAVSDISGINIIVC